jgi:hypothetical protein
VLLECADISDGSGSFIISVYGQWRQQEDLKWQHILSKNKFIPGGSSVRIYHREILKLNKSV